MIVWASALSHRSLFLFFFSFIPECTERLKIKEYQWNVLNTGQIHHTLSRLIGHISLYLNLLIAYPMKNYDFFRRILVGIMYYIVETAVQIKFYAKTILFGDCLAQ